MTEITGQVGRCGTSACINVQRRDGKVVITSDSDPGVELTATEAEWLAHIDAVHRGEIA